VSEIRLLRFVIEQAIAHIKNWRIITSRYRGHLDRIDSRRVIAIGAHSCGDARMIAASSGSRST
jgi:hypothetical protein